MASYRYSQLRGNFEGFYRDDNGQSDPGISSLYDFPTNDPSYAPFFGPAAAATSATWATKDGILPLDRPHQVKLYGNYAFAMGLNLGAGINLSSGKPLTPMAPTRTTRARAKFRSRRAAPASRRWTVSGSARRSRARWTFRRPTRCA